MKGKREDTYSVRLPSGFPHVGSSTAREMLAVLFAQKVPLVDDPGSGEEYLRLTLPRAQVHALQALAGGDPAGTALRRLVATFAGSSLPAWRPVRALPPAVLPVRPGVDVGRIAAAQPRIRSLSEPPPCYGLGAERWAREGPEAKNYVLKMQSLAAASAVIEPSPAKASLPSPWAIFFRLLIRYVVVPMGLLFLLVSIFGSGGGSTGGSASASPYPQWRPK